MALKFKVSDNATDNGWNVLDLDDEGCCSLVVFFPSSYTGRKEARGRAEKYADSLNFAASISPSVACAHPPKSTGESLPFDGYREAGVTK